ncbi:DUF2860 family protein [Seongchinamella sediminis]|nr:DUF2860 family protein [Seongchinamella sediminis]
MNSVRKLVLMALYCVSTGVHATDDKVRAEKGFYGNLLFGGGYLDLKSNLVSGNKLIDIGDDTIQSVNQSPDSNSDVYPSFSGEVNYAFGNRMEAFFGSSLEDLVTLDLSSRLGIRKEWDEAGVTGISLLFSGIPGEVWEDPYLAGSPRNDADRDSRGLRFDWRRIFGSNIYVQISTRDIDIDNERSGTDPALGLTTGEIQLLRRDGNDSRFALGYRWKNGNHILQPELIVGATDRDGDALSADTSSAKLTYGYVGMDWNLAATAQFLNSDFDQANPVYGRKLDSDGYVFNVTTFRNLAMGHGNWRAFGSLVYADINSDVDFHDASAFGVNLGLAYFFGHK